eukprot:gene14020-15479_t
MDSFDEAEIFPIDCDEAINAFKDSVVSVRKQIGSWRDEKEKQESENECLKNKLRNAERQLRDAQMKLKLKSQQKEDGDEDINRLKSLLEKANAENYHLCTDCCRLETLLQKQDEKIAGLEKQIDSADYFIKEMKIEAEKSFAEKSELLNTCKCLEDQLKEKNENIAKFIADRNNELAFSRKTIADLTKRLCDEETSTRLLSQQLREQRRFCEVLQEKLQSSQDEAAKALTEMDEMCKSNERESKLMVEKATQLNEQVESLTSLLSEQKSNQLAAVDRISVLQEKLGIKCQEQEELVEEKKNFKKLFEDSSSKNKELTILLNAKREQADASEIQYKIIIEKQQQNITEARTELKEKSREISELKMLQLSNEFEKREFQRKANEVEAALKHQEEARIALYKRNEDLQNNILQLQKANMHSAVNIDNLEKTTVDKSNILSHVPARIDQSKARYIENKRQQELLTNISYQVQVTQLQQQLQSKNQDHRATKIELEYVKEELRRVQNKATDTQRTTSLI